SATVLRWRRRGGGRPRHARGPDRPRWGAARTWADSSAEADDVVEDHLGHHAVGVADPLDDLCLGVAAATVATGGGRVALGAPAAAVGTGELTRRRQRVAHPQ